ncbi:hypothetical protein HDU89_007992 [Geranomyces variabilis]|nr:hypothetical protein HDU89_007992 [Geranomyces variabilis]
MPRFSFFAMDSEFRLGHLVSAHTPTLQQVYEWVTVVYPSTSQDLSMTVRGTGSSLTESDLNERNCDIYINFTAEQLGRPCGGVIPMASAVPTPIGRPAASPATSAAAFSSSSPSLKRKALGSGEDRDDFQGLLKSLCLTRDQACIVTGCPHPAELQCSHVLPPRIAPEWVGGHSEAVTRTLENGMDEYACKANLSFCDFDVPSQFKQRSSELLAGIPSEIRRATGQVERTAGYDVRNAITLTMALHKGFNDFKWGVVLINGEASKMHAFNLGMPAHHFPANPAPIRVPPLISYRGSEHFYRDQFPDISVFRYHFEECIRRNFQAAGEKSDDHPVPEREASTSASEAEENSLSDLAEDEWASMDLTSEGNRRIFKAMRIHLLNSDTVFDAAFFASPALE